MIVLPRDQNPRAMLLARLNALAVRIIVRDVLIAGTVGAAFGAVANAVLMAAGVPPREAALFAGGVALVAIAATAYYLRDRWTPAEAARLLERHRPESRNVIVTAEELARAPERASAWMAQRVFSDAAPIAAASKLTSVVRLAGPAVCCLAASAVWLVAALGYQQRLISDARDDVTARTGAATSEGSTQITATVTPPPYLAAAPVTHRDPPRIEAIEGSTLSIAVRGASSQWQVRLGESALTLTPRADGAVAAEVKLAESTYLALQQQVSRGAAETERRLIPVIVMPDRTPAIRIERPGKDLLLPDGSSSVSIASAATDDFGLRGLELRYTKVSGSGEQFEFEEGTVPLALERASERSWKGAAMLVLSKLNLQPGDAVVYRVVGHDARGPGAGSASSDTFLVEIAAPGQPTLAGFELPPDRDRYALSQQMIVLKIQRLLPREKTMSREAVRRESEGIAAEQRAVRANFIFLTGGHVEDEEQEAAHSHEIQEGRLEHSARREITDAIGHMSRAEQALAAVNPSAALPHARAAVEALQRAFGRNRYLLRTLPVRSRIDPSRRLSGQLDEAEDATRPPLEAADDPVERTTRRLIAALLDVAAGLQRTEPAPEVIAEIGGMAEQALAVDAASADWQEISTSLLEIRAALSGKRAVPEVRSRVQRSMTLLLAQARARTMLSSAVTTRGRLESAWAEEHRR